MKMIPGCTNPEEEEELIVQVAGEQLDALIAKVEAAGEKTNEKNRAANREQITGAQQGGNV